MARRHGISESLLYNWQTATASRLGEDVTEVMDYVPGCFQVIRHVWPKYTCTACDAITQAPAQAMPTPRGRATPSLLPSGSSTAADSTVAGRALRLGWQDRDQVVGQARTRQSVPIHHHPARGPDALRHRRAADNNVAENAMRTIALGRKNYLFAGSDVGGERVAAIHTLFQTAKLNGINPEISLRDTLARITDGHTINRIGALLPWTMISAAPAAK